jgi:predicted Zn-dependent protease
MKNVILLFVTILLVACAQNPLTGRKSLALVSNSSIFPQSFEAYNQTLSENTVLDPGAPESQMINRVGQRLKYAAEKFYADRGLSAKLNGYEWSFSVIQSDQLNAWCMPGGKVAFYTGILPVCESEAGVAVVMGHEIVHALAGHSAEKMSQSIVAELGGAIVGASINDEQWSMLFNQYYPVGAQLSLLHYGRNMESDADIGGVKLMAMAGYDPHEAIAFWKRMEAAGSSGTPQFLSTHPSHATRIADIEALLPEAMALYNASPYKGK